MTEIEAQANAFAMELLMPRGKFLKAARACPDLNDEDAIRKLARQFGVSVTVATVRLIELRRQSRSTPQGHC